MTDDLQKLDGVGSAREEDLNELGYEAFSDLAEADHEQLAEDVPRLSEDKALDLVVQAQNEADLEEASVEEDASGDETSDEEAEESESEAEVETEEDEESGPSASEDEAEAESEEDDSLPETVPFTLEFGGPNEYDTFFATVYEFRNELVRMNRNPEVVEEILAATRDAGADSSIEVDLKPEDLNELHNAVRSKAVDYQGDNLIDQMEALDRVETSINAVREEHLF